LILIAEIFTNACRHGGGPDRLAAGTVDGWFVCEVADRGPGLDDLLAGHRRPHAGGDPHKGL
jgi:anti-sigma regulatory factor (Ser/Thr protein kinase)